MFNEKLKNNIYRYRKESKLTQERVAEKLSISLNSYRKIEKGETQLISSRVEEIAAAFHISAEELLLGNSGNCLEQLKKAEELNAEYARTIEQLRSHYEMEIEDKKKQIALLEEIIRNKEQIIEILRNTLNEK